MRTTIAILVALQLAGCASEYRRPDDSVAVQQKTVAPEVLASRLHALFDLACGDLEDKPDALRQVIHSAVENRIQRLLVGFTTREVAQRDAEISLALQQFFCLASRERGDSDISDVVQLIADPVERHTRTCAQLLDDELADWVREFDRGLGRAP